MMAVQQKVTDKGVFLIGSNAGPSPVAGAQCSPYFFSTPGRTTIRRKWSANTPATRAKNVIAMAPNYQAGRTLSRASSVVQGGTITDEIYTPLNQQDFSAEFAQVASKKPDALYVFYPGGLGVNFVKQFQQAGLNKSITVMSTSTVDGSTLPALRDAAIGMLSGTFWGPDFPNEANQKFVAAFEKKYNHIPSQYAAQGYDAGTAARQ